LSSSSPLLLLFVVVVVLVDYPQRQQQHSMLLLLLFVTDNYVQSRLLGLQTASVTATSAHVSSETAQQHQVGRVGC
jgi:hypothetical protein